MSEWLNEGNRNEREVKMMDTLVSQTKWVAGAQSCEDRLTECVEYTLSIVSVVMLKSKEAEFPSPLLRFAQRHQCWRIQAILHV